VSVFEEVREVIVLTRGEIEQDQIRLEAEFDNDMSHLGGPERRYQHPRDRCKRRAPCQKYAMAWR
jgi:hypothetical protein